MSSDVERGQLTFIRIFQSYGFKQGTELYARLYEFLMDPINSCYLQTYFVLSSGLLHVEDVIERIADLAGELKFTLEDGYTYRKLYSLDPEWYEFFRENTYPCGGHRYVSDKRRGVDRSKTDRIMLLRQGPPLVSLENAIMMDCEATLEAMP